MCKYVIQRKQSGRYLSSISFNEVTFSSFVENAILFSDCNTCDSIIDYITCNWPFIRQSDLFFRVINADEKNIIILNLEVK